MRGAGGGGGSQELLQAVAWVPGNGELWLLGFQQSKMVTSESTGWIRNTCEHAHGDGGKLLGGYTQSSGEWLKENPSPK